jgi:crotonobetainyl-CoA:carnitine CoA-transferase CaiB-like acyl-CoA transferase
MIFYAQHYKDRIKITLFDENCRNPSKVYVIMKYVYYVVSNMLLNDIRVLDVTHAVAGPTATQILADLGAEVIKIERPNTGDIFRDSATMGPSIFVALNRNKKSVVIDLSKPEGRDLLLELVKKSDVMIENLAPGDAEKYGITYDVIKNINPKIIYCSITSFGEGPYKYIPAFDPVIEAMTGFMSVTGFPPDKYVRAGVSFLDMVAGMLAAIGVITALYKRRINNEGCQIEISLADSGLFIMSYWIPYYKKYKKNPSPVGSGHWFGAPYQLFKFKDGYLYIAILSDKQWEKFCKALGFEDLLKDERYKTTADRAKRKSELEGELAKRFESMSAKETFDKLLKSGEYFPVGPLYTIKDIFDDPHFAQRGIIKKHSYNEEEYWTAITPIRIGNNYTAGSGKIPRLGEHTRQILRELLNIPEDKISELEKKKIIQSF